MTLRSSRTAIRPRAVSCASRLDPGDLSPTQPHQRHHVAAVVEVRLEGRQVCPWSVDHGTQPSGHTDELPRWPGAPGVQPDAAVSARSSSASSSASRCAVSRRSTPRSPRWRGACSAVGHHGAPCAAVVRGGRIALVWPCLGQLRRGLRRQPQRQRLADRPGLGAAVDHQPRSTSRSGPARSGSMAAAPRKMAVHEPARAVDADVPHVDDAAAVSRPGPAARRRTRPRPPRACRRGRQRGAPSRSRTSSQMPSVRGAANTASCSRLASWASRTCWIWPCGPACSWISTPATAGMRSAPRSSRGRSSSGAWAMSYGPNSGGRVPRAGVRRSSRSAAVGLPTRSPRRPAPPATAREDHDCSFVPASRSGTCAGVLRPATGSQRARRWNRARRRRATVSGSSSTTSKSARSTRCTTS